MDGRIASSGLQWVDWLVIGAYFGLLVVSGIWLSRRQKDTDDYFLAGRRMPSWAVAISLYATATSAATFIGAPDEAYAGNLTFLSTNIGTILAVFIVAFVFIPAFYRHSVSTVYQLLEIRFGEQAKKAASWTFLIGRVFASGARVYIAAFALSYVIWGDSANGHLVLAVCILSAAGVLYTIVGGISTVIWTDVLQAIVFITSAIACAILLASTSPLPFGETLTFLRNAEGGSKLRVLDFDPNLLGGGETGAPFLSKPYTLFTACTGWMLLGLAAYGTDQDLAQRLLTCKSRARASLAALSSLLMTLPVTAVFLVIGLLLYVHDAAGTATVATGNESNALGARAFLRFLISEMPAGLGGLMVAGLFAAGLSSLDSGLNAMASAFVNDFYKPRHPNRDAQHYVRISRFAVAFWGMMLCAFACVCVFWHGQGGETLLQFALRVMTFAYSGLVAVFLAALLTRRGNSRSVIAALIVGFFTVLVMEPPIWKPLWAFVAGALDIQANALKDVAFPWRLTFASIVSFGVCCLGRRATKS